MLSKYSAARLTLAALMLATTPKIFGQVANNADTSTSSTGDNESIVLSPFVVNAEEDNGYMAKNTLAGTRLRTELKDVGSAISVVTAQFLQDTDSHNNAQLLKYTTNTEVAGVGGNFSNAGGGATASEPSLLHPNSNTRVRGLTAADNTRDYFLTEIPWDSYNIGRVDIQRGPNSILFGLGSPAGIINNSTNTASLFKDSGKIEVRFDDQGSARESLDYNKVLLKDELGLRVAALDDDTQYRQRPAYNRDERYYGAIKYDPSFLKQHGMNTEIRANYEKGDIHANRPRELTPQDFFTPWWTQLGQQTYDAFAATTITHSTTPVLSGVANPAFSPWSSGGNGIGNNATGIFVSPNTKNESAFRNWQTGNNYWGIGPNNNVDPSQIAEATRNNYFGIGSPGAWDSTIEGPGGDFSAPLGINSYTGYANSVLTPTAANPTNQGLPYKSIGAYKDKQISDPKIFNFYDKLLDGPDKWEKQNFETYNIALSQTFFDNRLGIEAVYDKQNYGESNINGVNNAIYVDINATEPGTSPAIGGTNPANPYVGEAYVVGPNSGSTYKSVAVSKRLTAFGELRATDFLSRGWLTDLLGTHTFTGLYSDERKDTTSLNHVLYAMDDSYGYALNGTKSGASKVDSDGREVQTIIYLSSSLAGDTSPSQANLSNLKVAPVPHTLTDFTGITGAYVFDSHWNKPVNPSDPGYVNPAAPFNNTRNTDASKQNQGNNLLNYYQFHQLATNPVLDFNQGGQGLYNSGQKTWRDVKSEAFVWQGHLLDNVIVPTFGWRKDKFRGAGINASQNGEDQINPLDPKFEVDHNQALVSGESRSWSVVVHTPQSWVQKTPFHTGISLFYNKSDNFQPHPGDVDVFGHSLANPQGKTKDYGIVLSALDEKINFKINWYKTNVTNDRLQGFQWYQIGNVFGSMLQSAYRVRHKDVSNPWKWDYSQWTANGGQAEAEKAAQLVLDTYNSSPDFKSFVSTWGMTADVDSTESSSNSTPVGINATADTLSKGVEFELQAEPVKGWNLSVNASKTNATQQNIGGALKSFIQFYDPIFNGPIGDLRQWYAGDSNNFRSLWAADVKSQYNLLAAEEGSNTPDTRTWRYNFVSDYRFNKEAFGGHLKGVNVGAAYRWEAGNVIGFPVITGTDATTGQPSLVYDVQHPYKGPSDWHLDAWVGYERKDIFRGIDWRIQLNFRDLFAKKTLIPVAVEPDGTNAQYRIPALTSWSLTNTFTF